MRTYKLRLKADKWFFACSLSRSPYWFIRAKIDARHIFAARNTHSNRNWPLKPHTLHFAMTDCWHVIARVNDVKDRFGSVSHYAVQAFYEHRRLILQNICNSGFWKIPCCSPFVDFTQRYQFPSKWFTHYLKLKTRFWCFWCLSKFDHTNFLQLWSDLIN